MSALGQPLPFTILTQSPSSDYDPATGDTTEIWRIEFQTASGVKAWVTVPWNDYTADNVAAIISAKAGEIERVQALGS
jgi:hypothetical protein